MLKPLFVITAFLLGSHAALAAGLSPVPAYCQNQAAAVANDAAQSRSAAIIAGWRGTAEENQAVKEFYAPCNFALAWSAKQAPTTQALYLLDAISRAGDEGLNPRDYLPVPPQQMLAKEQAEAREDSAGALAGFDLALTIGAIRLVKDLECGRAESDLQGPKKRPECERYDPSGFIWGQLAQGKNPAGSLGGLEPNAPGYVRTKAALKIYAALAAGDDPDIVPVPSAPISPGKPYAGLQKLAQRLHRTGDFTGGMTEGNLYEGPIVDAVIRFQQEHGLHAAGNLDKETCAAINVPFSKRAEQLALTLERWRAVPRTFSQPPVVVNIPEFRLRAYEDGLKVKFSMAVIVGKAYRHKTPVFSDMISSVVLRPYWNVPNSIQRGEVAPAIARDPNYLAKHNFELVGSNGQVLSGNGTAYIEQIRSGKVRVRQRPGPKNSLGLIKFDFPNGYSVYLHGTPAQQLFSQVRRDFSHGCIRLQDPPKLAVWVLRNNDGWTQEKIAGTIAGTQTVVVKVAKPIPILIVYGTGFAAEDNRIYFLADIYGYDAELEKTLAKLSAKRHQSEPAWMNAALEPAGKADRVRR